MLLTLNSDSCWLADARGRPPANAAEPEEHIFDEIIARTEELFFSGNTLRSAASMNDCEASPNEDHGASCEYSLQLVSR
ncbi:MAG: hypothetical protein AAGG44_06605 [Planctomycetota bacterium]